MAKVTYTNLKLKKNSEVKIVKYNDCEIEVSQYLPIEEKCSLISITAQGAKENNICNPLVLEMLFHIYLVFEYTNISFTEKQKEDLFKLYDNLKSNKLLDLILDAIPEEEYDTLYTYLIDYIENQDVERRSVSGLIQSLINDLPAQAEAMKEILNNFDETKYSRVIEFAQAANGNRPI